MKFILDKLKKILPKYLPSPLGRWQIENCMSKTNIKVDLSNEDHCGPCGQYAKSKLKELNKTNINNTRK